jgi:hypothetical protein
VTQLSVVAFAPRVDVVVSGQRQTVLPAGIDGNLFDENVLNGLQQSGNQDRVGAANSKSTSGTIT